MPASIDARRRRMSGAVAVSRGSNNVSSVTAPKSVAAMRNSRRDSRGNEDRRRKDVCARNLDDAGDRLSQRCRERRRLHAPRHPQKEFIVEQEPQPAQPLTHGRLRNVEGARRRRNASEPSERVKDDQEPQIQGR